MMDEQVNSDFDRARQKALFRELLSVFRRESNQLIPYHEVRKRVAPEAEPAAAFHHHAEARVREAVVAHGPASRAADHLREHGPRPQLHDDVNEGIVHLWTI